VFLRVTAKLLRVTENILLPVVFCVLFPSFEQCHIYTCIFSRDYDGLTVFYDRVDEHVTHGQRLSDGTHHYVTLLLSWCHKREIASHTRICHITAIPKICIHILQISPNHQSSRTYNGITQRLQILLRRTLSCHTRKYRLRLAAFIFGCRKAVEA
jgi:hypothetical protein